MEQHVGCPLCLYKIQGDWQNRGMGSPQDGTFTGLGEYTASPHALDARGSPPRRSVHIWNENTPETRFSKKSRASAFDFVGQSSIVCLSHKNIWPTTLRVYIVTNVGMCVRASHPRVAPRHPECCRRSGQPTCCSIIFHNSPPPPRVHSFWMWIKRLVIRDVR